MGDKQRVSSSARGQAGQSATIVLVDNGQRLPRHGRVRCEGVAVLLAAIRRIRAIRRIKERRCAGVQVCSRGLFWSKSWLSGFVGRGCQI